MEQERWNDRTGSAATIGDDRLSTVDGESADHRLERRVHLAWNEGERRKSDGTGERNTRDD